MRSVFPVLAIVIFGLVLPSGAAAPPTAFNAAVASQAIRPAGPCADGAFRCGTAIIDGIADPARWQFFLATFVPASNACGQYTATVTFTLADGSSLELAEAGLVCGPGNSFFATPGFSWGNPDHASGEWVINGATGQFTGMTGAGSSDLLSAGARVGGKYRAH